MQKENLFQKYESPDAKDYPKDAVDPILGPGYRNVIIGVVYNKSGIKPEDAPKSLEDLVNPQIQRQDGHAGSDAAHDHHPVGSEPSQSDGKREGRKVYPRSRRHEADLVESLLPSAERVMTGETPLSITYVKYAYVFGKQGAPLDYVRMPKMIGDGHYIALATKSPHPSTGKAFIDYFLDNESMNTMAKLGEFVNRKGVLPPLPDADKIGFVEMEDLSNKEFAEKKKEYQQIFLR